MFVKVLIVSTKGMNVAFCWLHFIEKAFTF